MDTNVHSVAAEASLPLRPQDEPSVSGYYSQERSDVAGFLPATFVRTLEIGCGAGEFSKQFLRSADENWAVEPNPDAARLAREGKMHVLVGTYDEVESELPDGYFDLVICNDVIEHMRDHDHFLRAIQSKMRAGGVIVGSVPNMLYFTAFVKLLAFKDWPYSDQGILDRTHLRFFTAKSFGRSLTNAGFTIERLQGMNNFLRIGSPSVSPLMTLPLKIAAGLVVVLSFGYWRDILFRQLVFRGKMSSEGIASGGENGP
jgi:SAM-dependent methyltransferase